jgi:hypothetical protein
MDSLQQSFPYLVQVAICECMYRAILNSTKIAALNSDGIWNSQSMHNTPECCLFILRYSESAAFEVEAWAETAEGVCESLSLQTTVGEVPKCIEPL